MMSMAQTYSPHPGAMQGHPGMQQSHPMAQHPSQQGNGHPGQAMGPQMHMVSGPGGPQVSQGGAPIMAGMPPGGGMPSAHALQHLSLNSNPQQVYLQQQQQQQQMGAFGQVNPNMIHNQQYQAQMHQRRQQQLAMQQQAQQQGQYGPVPMGMPNGMQGMSQAQYQAMQQQQRLRPVNLPQHLQAQQQQIMGQGGMGLSPQDNAQHQLMMQQIAMQQQQHAQNNHGQVQGGQIPPHMQAQIAAQQHQEQQRQQAQQAQQQAQQHAAAQNQNQQQPQPQAQQQPQNPPQQQQPSQQQQVHQQSQAQAQQAAHQAQAQAQAQAQVQHQQAQAMQQRQAMLPKAWQGQVLLQLFNLSDKICHFQHVTKSVDSYMGNGATRPVAQSMKQQNDLAYWQNVVVDKFFSPIGTLRYHAMDAKDNSTKAYEIPYLALARYFNTHFEGGIKNMQLHVETPKEHALNAGRYQVDAPKANFVYWFENNTHVVANGKLSLQYDDNQKIELFDFYTTGYEEYLSRSHVVDLARPLHEWQKEWHKVNEGSKQSPEMNKKGKAKQLKSPNTQPPDIDYPETRLKGLVLTQSVSQFLEIAEVMSQMNPLFHYSFQNPTLNAYAALDQYMANVQAASNNSNPPSNATNQTNGPAAGQRTPGPGQFPLGAGVSPAAGHLNLPGGSPHIGGSPAQAHMQAPSMALQHSQQGTSSSGPSANTSPNVSNKRRRPSGVKEEDSQPVQVNGAGINAQKVKQSPRVGNNSKRQKVMSDNAANN